MSRLVYDLIFSEVYLDGDQFRGKLYILMNVFMLSIGVFFQKKVIQHNPDSSLMVLIFYIFIVAFFTQFAGSRVMRDSSDITVEVWDVYFSFGYFVTLLNVLTIYMMLILMEAYRYIALIYINKKGQISKVTIFGALHGFFVVIIILVFEQTSVFDRIFVGMITVAYFLLFISKYVQSRAGKKSTTGKKLIFKRIFRREEFATQLISASKIQIKDNYYHSSFTTVGSGTGDRTSVFSNYFQARSTKVKASNYAQITNKDTEEGGKANLSVNRASKKDASINMSIASESQSEI